MSNFAKSGLVFQRIPSDSTLCSSQDSHYSTVDDLENNPFDGKKTWDEFKREYYLMEKRMKKALESLHVILIEFTKQISLNENTSTNNSSSLFKDFQNISSQIKEDLSQMSDLFRCLKRKKEDVDEPIKLNMLKRFKEIHVEHEKEYNRLNNSFEMNKKKLELFNETLKLGELYVDKKIGSATGLMMEQNQGLQEAVATSNRIVSHANLLSQTFASQNLRLNKINLQAKKLIEEFGSVSEILKRIKYFKLKKTIVIFAVLVILAIMVIFKIAARLA